MLAALKRLDRLPDRCFDIVFGKGSYEKKVRILKKRDGYPYYPKGILFWYRSLFHLSASFLAGLVFYLFLGDRMWIASAILIVWMVFQEFYLHGVLYGQPLFKGIADFIEWTFPQIILVLILV